MTNPAHGPVQYPNSMSHASGLAGLIEEVALPGKHDRHPSRAVAKAEEIVQGPHRFQSCGHATERARNSGHHPECARSAVDARGGTGRDLDEHRSPGQVAPVIEVGPVTPNLPQLAEIRGEFARHVVPRNVGGGVENSRRLVVRIRRPEIAQQAGAQTLGLADIQDAAGRVEHPVHGRTVLRERAHPPAELSRSAMGSGATRWARRATHR